MNSTAAISALVIVVVIGTLKCNAHKTRTKLIVAVLERRPRHKATSVGIDLALEAAKNSSDLKGFFDKYEIVMDGPHYTKVPFFR